MARILRFRTQVARRRFVVGQLREAANLCTLGVTGALPLDEAVVGAFLAVNAAHRVLLEGPLDEEVRR